MRARILVPTAFLFAITLATMVTGAVFVYAKDLERVGRSARSSSPTWSPAASPT